MNITPDNLVISPQESDFSSAQAIQQLVQFARTVRYRKQVILFSLVVSGLLGGLYYATATRRAAVPVVGRLEPNPLPGES